jgi:D-ribose pyranase
MNHRWEYLRLAGEPELDKLGAEGWELVAIRGEEWLFKRPAPDPAERFTLEQRRAALSSVDARLSTGRHLLNPQIASLIRQINHTQMLLIADRGFPVPSLPTVVDISLTANIPTIPQVLAAILPDLPADRVIVAQEQQMLSPARWQDHQEGPLPVEAVPHLEFKQIARYATGCIRTGDSVPYANVLLVGG